MTSREGTWLSQWHAPLQQLGVRSQGQRVEPAKPRKGLRQHMDQGMHAVLWPKEYEHASGSLKSRTAIKYHWCAQEVNMHGRTPNGRQCSAPKVSWQRTVQVGGRRIAWEPDLPVCCAHSHMPGLQRGQHIFYYRQLITYRYFGEPLHVYHPISAVISKLKGHADLAPVTDSWHAGTSIGNRKELPGLNWFQAGIS